MSLLMTDAFISHLSNELTGLKSAGLYKSERVISSTQSAEIEVGGEKVLNFCANNYLGLADSAELRAAATEALQRYGDGMASVRFICSTQEEHKKLEATISSFLGLEDTILYGSCFDANGGLFETLLGEEDAIISDALKHASIIDGVRLSKAKRFRYANNDMADLEARLNEAKESHDRLYFQASRVWYSLVGRMCEDEVRFLKEEVDELCRALRAGDLRAVGFVQRNFISYGLSRVARYIAMS